MEKLFFAGILMLASLCSPTPSTPPVPAPVQEMLDIVEGFVTELENPATTFPLMKAAKLGQLTTCGTYRVQPLGRMVNVKIMQAVPAVDYEILKNDLAAHFADDARVKRVFVSQVGTVMVDCRN